MKMTQHKPMLSLAAVLTATAALNALADSNSSARGDEKSYTGRVVSVDTQEHTLRVKSWMLSSKEFNLGENCAYFLLDADVGTPADLHPGQKVTVRYQNAHGIQIADRVEERAQRFEGMVVAIDPGKHELTLHKPGLDEQMTIADGCRVTLHGGKAGTLADLHPGNEVTVAYDTPNDTPTAREILLSSVAFTGKLTAMDLDEKTVKARGALGTKKFHLADNCAIVIDGRTDGKLSQLKLNDRLMFSYDTINGVNVVNRIALVTEEQQTNSWSTTTPAYRNYPAGF